MSLAHLFHWSPVLKQAQMWRHKSRDFMHAWLHARSNTLLDSEFQPVDSRFWVLQFQYLSVELGFQIPIVSRTPASLSCILEFKAQDSVSHKHKFPKIPESTSKTLSYIT